MTTEQNNKPERGEVNPAEAAWLMFEKTGKLSYYLLYKKLKQLPFRTDGASGKEANYCKSALKRTLTVWKRN